MAGNESERMTGTFSVGGNLSEKYLANYSKIFGHEGPVKSKKKKKRVKKNQANIVIKVR